MSGAYSMSRVESGFLGPLEGWIIQRFGSRNAITAGLVVFCLGFVVLSQINSAVTFYLAFLLMSMGAGIAGYSSAMASINNWFRRRRTMAIGIAMMGMGLGGVIFAPLVALSIEGVGWQTTALGAGIFAAVIGIPISRLVRFSPEPYGYLPDGDKPQSGPLASQTPVPSQRAEYDFTVKEALRTRAFWILSSGHALGLLVISIIMLHQVPYLEDDLGYSKGFAALVVMVMTGTTMFGQLAAGALSDRFPKPFIVAACIVGHCVGLLLLATAGSIGIIMLSAVVQGISWGVRAPITTALRGDYFGRKSFAMIMGYSNFILMIGMTIGPILSGYLADRHGYAFGFKIIALSALLGALMFLFLRNPQPAARARSEGAAARI